MDGGTNGIREKRGVEQNEESKINGVMTLLSSWPRAFMIDNIFISSFLICYV